MNWRKVLVMLLGILILICGVYSLLTPLSTFLVTGYIVGVLILCDAVANIIAWFETKKYANISGWYLVSAIISAIFGIIIIANVRMQFAVDMAIVYIVSAWIVALAISRINLAIRLKRVNDALPNFLKNSRWIGLILVAILMIIFAIVCMMQPGIMSVLLGTLISWVMIFNGLTLVTLGSYIPNLPQK